MPTISILYWLAKIDKADFVRHGDLNKMRFVSMKLVGQLISQCLKRLIKMKYMG